MPDDVSTWTATIERIGFGGAILVASIIAGGWVLVRLIGSKNGILTEVGRDAAKFLRGALEMISQITPAIQQQADNGKILADNSKAMLDLHQAPESPCNTTPLRRAGVALADAIDVIGPPSVKQHTDKMRAELQPDIPPRKRPSDVVILVKGDDPGATDSKR